MNKQVLAPGTRLARWLLLAMVLLGSGGAMTASATEVPIAQSVEIQGGAPPVGSVVRYDETADTFTLSDTPRDGAVYGVVGERPAIVFVSATATVPVITSGVSAVRVQAAGGAIARGDTLTTSNQAGVAQLAPVSESAVFAIALEPATFAAGESESLILAEVGVSRAQAYQEARRAAQAETEETAPYRSVVRSVLAGVLVLGGLGFLLYSFRSILATGIQSVGRNPRARRTVLLLAVGSLVMVVVVTVLLLLAAIGVLVLPV